MKSPLRLERRLTQPRALGWQVPLISISGALLLGAVVLLLTAKNPIDVYWRIIESGFASKTALRGTLVAATPLAFTGMCAAATFRIGIINIGGEGQFFVGAIGAAFVGIAMDGAPTSVILLSMILMGALIGSAYAALVGVLKAKFNTNEIITSLMLNYIAGIILDYLIFGSKSYLRDPRSMGFPTGKALPKGSWWPTYNLGSAVIPFGFLLAIVAGAGILFLYRRTRFGFEASVIADSPAAARYSGMRTRAKIISVMAISGALAGVGGATDVGNFRHVLDAKGLQLAGYGYTGIVVAALARFNPFSAVFVAIIIGGLTNAGYALQGPNFQSGLVGTLQGLILFTAVAGEVLMRYRIRVRNNQKNVAVAS
ncbi:MAG: ABC transporter permease [Actinomycetes bacterium]